MLAFFRKYEKTFLVVLVCAPMLFTLGISTTITSAIGGHDPGSEVIGKLFGEDVTRAQFERGLHLYKGTNPYAQADDGWRFMALLRAARKAHIGVSDEEVGDQIFSEMKWDIARYQAMEECRAEHIDLSGEDGQRKFQQKFFQHMMEARFTSEDYRKVVGTNDHGGLTVPEYEEQVRCQETVSRYLDALRAMAVVTPADVWKEFQEQHHRRTLDLVTVPAEAHRPDLAAVASDSPGYVTEAQVKDFYERNQPDFDTPRRVRLEYLAVSLEGAEQGLGAPSEADLGAYFDVHRDEIAPLSTRTYADLVAESLLDDDKVRKPLLAEQARAVADRLLDAAAVRVAAAEAKGEKADLAAIGSAVRAELGAPLLEYGDTGLAEESAVAEHKLLAGTAASRWFRTGTVGDVSDVLAGPRGWFIVRATEVHAASSPEYAAIKDQVREAYAWGSVPERRRWYDEHKATRYQQDARYDLEVLVASDAYYGDAVAPATSHVAARDDLDTAVRIAKGWPKGAPWGRLAGEASVKHAAQILPPRTFAGVTRAQVEADPLLGRAAVTLLVSQDELDPSPPMEAADGKGWFVLRITHKHPQRVKAFDEAEAEVKDEVRLARGVERAQGAAEALVAALKGLDEAGVKKALAERGLAVRTTEPFARDATSLEGIPDAGRLVGQAFSTEAKVGGGFDATVMDTAGNRVFVLRVAARVDAPDTTWAATAPNLRRELLSKKRGEFATSETRRTYLEAKAITPEHVRYVTERRDGPGGAWRLKLRQVFIPPDRTILDGWLSERALEQLKKAQAELAQGRRWEAVVDKYSEDDATRNRGGELPPVSRGELGRDFGTEFEEAVFALSEGTPSGPIKSDRGYHLVLRAGTRLGKAVFRHLLVRTDPDARALPQDVRDRAWAEARTHMDEALAKLGQGLSFSQVAQTYGDLKEPNGQGQELEVEYPTRFERAALAEPVEWELPEGSPDAKDPLWVPPAVQVPGPDGAPSWQLFCCARDPFDRKYGTSPRRDRIVLHIEARTRDDIEVARSRLAAWLKKQAAESEDRPSFGAIEAEFRRIAADLSVAPDRSKGGAFGILQLENDVRPYGDEFLGQISTKADGSVVTPGHRTGIFRGETGWHLVEVTGVELAGTTRQDDIADQLLRGSDW